MIGSADQALRGFNPPRSSFGQRQVTEQRPELQAERTASSPIPRRVLLVEDNADSAEMLAEILRSNGFPVTVAGDGESGLAAALKSPPDLALLDIGLPRMDGFAVARQLRSQLPTTKLFALSGYGDEEHRRRSVEAGFDAHLVKPVELDDLLAILDSFDPGNRAALARSKPEVSERPGST